MFGQKKGFTKFAFTFGAGLITGIAFGLLYAPMTGRKMQKKVADVTENFIDRVDDLQQSVRKIV